MPYVQVWVDDPEVNLTDADDDALIEEIEKRGYQVITVADSCDPAPVLNEIWNQNFGEYRAPIAQIDLSVVRHKLQIGMTDAAKSEALFLVERALDLRHVLTN